MIRLQSGAILCGHRHPQYSINVSHDNGLNWDGGALINNTVEGIERLYHGRLTNQGTLYSWSACEDYRSVSPETA